MFRFIYRERSSRLCFKRTCGFKNIFVLILSHSQDIFKERQYIIAYFHHSLTAPSLEQNFNNRLGTFIYNGTLTKYMAYCEIFRSLLLLLEFQQSVSKAPNLNSNHFRGQTDKQETHLSILPISMTIHDHCL